MIYLIGIILLVVAWMIFRTVFRVILVLIAVGFFSYHLMDDKNELKIEISKIINTSKLNSVKNIDLNDPNNLDNFVKKLDNISQGKEQVDISALASQVVDVDQLKKVKDLIEQKAKKSISIHRNQITGQAKQKQEELMRSTTMSNIKTTINGMRDFSPKDKALLYAAEKGQTMVAETLLNNQANVNTQDKYGRTPLILATINYQLKMIKTLISYYANPNIKDNNKQTALMHATLTGHMDTFQLLVSDMNVNAENKGEALIMAASLGRVEMVRMLIQNHVNINYQDSNGQTALMHAAHNGYKKITKNLVDYGADLNIQDKKGQTALTIAKKRSRIKIIEILQSSGEHTVKSND